MVGSGMNVTTRVLTTEAEEDLTRELGNVMMEPKG